MFLNRQLEIWHYDFIKENDKIISSYMNLKLSIKNIFPQFFSFK